LGEALHLKKDLNGLSLKGDVLFLERGARVPSSEIVSRPRVGVDYAEDHAEWPLRFYIRGSEFISRK
jgi:DNA-3-methyladenine glycosylase